MSDLEERPSKIRKTEASESFQVPPADSLEAAKPPSDTPHNPTITTPGADLPFQNGIPEEEAKGSDQTTLSKSQLKKIRKKEAWDAGKDYRRLLRKEKDKEKKERKAIARQELSAKIASGEIAPLSPAPQPKGYSRPTQVPVGIVLDCDFNQLMTEKELISLGAQITRSYSENRCAGYRTHLAITSWGGQLKERFETVLNRNHESWKGVMFLEESFVGGSKLLDEVMRGKAGGKIAGALKGEGITEEEETATGKSRPLSGIQENSPDQKSNPVADVEPTETEDAKNLENGKSSDILPPEQSTEAHTAAAPTLVYLSSDSPDTLTTLSPYTTYIIGGIVDKNRHKGLCYKRATELGIPTAKLPIGEFMVMNSRSVLAVNHVVEIMLRWLECGDWGEAFEKVIPKRKGGVLRSKTGEGEQEKGTSLKGEGEETDGEEEEE